MARSVFLKLEMQIARDEGGGLEHRFNYGRELLSKRAGRQRLEKGLMAKIVEEAERNGIKLSEQEIQRRMRLAEIYPTRAHRRQALMLMGSWSGIVNAGFPTVEVDESDDPEDLAAAAGVSTSPPDDFEQLTLIPGFGETIKVRGKTIPLAEATVGQAKEYRETYRQIHENFGKTLALIEAAVEAMDEGSGGDDDANAVEAWQRGNETEADHGDHDPPLDPEDI